MRTPMLARRKAIRLSLLAASGLLLAACTGDVTAPPGPRLAPSGATKALRGAGDGLYTFTVDPNHDASIWLGASRLDVPAHSICNLGTSKYGPQYWNDDCDDEQKLVTITAHVRDAGSDHPSIEFHPAMRFDPDERVQLSIAVTNAATLSNMTVMYYCHADYNQCVDESLTDSSLKTTVDKANGMVSRRIKHFSGYVVAERSR